MYCRGTEGPFGSQVTNTTALASEAKVNFSMFWPSSANSVWGLYEGDLGSLLGSLYSKSLKNHQNLNLFYKIRYMKYFLKKILTTKSQVNTILLAVAIYMLFASWALIHHLNERINKEQYLRICPEPYVCVIPPKQWKGKVPMGLTHYKRIEV